MSSDVVIREEPGAYRLTASYYADGGVMVRGESVAPITMTVRVEDVWDRIPPKLRRYSYTVSVLRDGDETKVAKLEDVAPDARVYLDFEKTFEMVFT